jgi:hypothetical protein
MAFQNSLSGRMEELRFPALRSPDHDTFTATGPATARPESGFFGQSSGDARASLQRRFTTDASKMSPRPFGGPQQFSGMSQTVRTSFFRIPENGGWACTGAELVESMAICTDIGAAETRPRPLLVNTLCWYDLLADS